MGVSVPLKRTILIPVPQYGFDPTETSIPWSKLKERDHRIIFATPTGSQAQADKRMVTGEDLPWPLRKTLMAQSNAVQAYRRMESSEEFQNPISYEQINPENFDGLLLPGGHDKGMREYLENKKLQKVVAFFFDNNKPVGAICHGTLLAARSLSTSSGKSVLWGKKTTGLTKSQELIAYQLTRAWLGDYYRTYQIPMADELVSFLKSPGDYDPGPGVPIPMGKDSDRNLKPGFIVRDGMYLSARWPGDAYKFSHEFVQMIEEVV